MRQFSVFSFSCFSRQAALLLAAALTLGGCASTGEHTAASPSDPYEGFNRSMYSFNKGVDKVVLRPAAKVYDTVVPTVIDQRVDSALANLGELGNIGNALLQAKFKHALTSTGRLLVNSTLGLAGLFDPATSMGLQRHDEDFGQTLATWGLGQGPYLVLPLLGPSTVRDALAKPVDRQMDPVAEIEHVPTRNTIMGLDLLNTRQRLFELEPVLEESIDEYAFVRDAYLQRRNYQIHDGNPPAPPSDDCDPAVDEC